jgi:heptosyltransferase-2
MIATNPTSKRILLVQLADIGDLILTTPALYALRTAQPNAHLTLLTTRHSVPVLEADLVDEVITLDRRQFNSSLAFFRTDTLKQIFALREKHFDTVVFFHHLTLWLGTLKFALIARATGARRVIGLDNGNGWFLTEKVHDDGFGAKHQARYWLSLVERLGVEAADQRAQVAFDSGVLPIPATTQKRVIIHTGSGGYSVARRWLPSHFAVVADALLEQQAQVIFVGTPADGADEAMQLMKMRPLSLVGKTSLTQLADLIRSADLYIGADSGVMHIAATVRTPVIAIFGSSNAEAWGPWSPNGNVVVLQSFPLCSPCSYVGHRVGAREGCAARTCMVIVTPQQVLNAADKLLNGQTIASPMPPVLPRTQAPKVLFAEIDHDWMGEATFGELVGEFLVSGRLHLVVFSEYATLLQSQRDPIVKVILERAALVVPCGAVLAWAGNWKRQHLPQVLDETTLLADLLQVCQAKGATVFLVGRFSERAVTVLKQELPQLQAVGSDERGDNPKYEADVAAKVNASGANVLLMGGDKAEANKWLARNSPRLQVSIALAIGDDLMRDLAGRTPEAPEWMREVRLGWLYLLFRQPKRWAAVWRVPRFVARIVLKG